MRFNLRKHVSDVLFIAVVLILLARFVSITEEHPMPVSVVTSGSMEPTLSRGDIVFWYPCKITDVHAGDIIVYKSYIEKDKYVLHRVIDIKEENGEIMLVTKGDANEYPDQAGAHIVEPYIRENHLIGKAVGVGAIPFRIPVIGYIFLAIGSAISSISQAISAGGTPFAATPLVVPAIAFMLLLFSWEDKGTKKYRKLNLILGPEKVRVRRVFLYTFIAFLALMLSTLLFANSIVTVSVGVGAKTQPANLEIPLQPGNISNQDITVINDGFLPVKCVVFLDGNVKEIGVVNEKIKMVEAGKHDSITATFFAYASTKPGVYNGKIVGYSSPFWVVLPDAFMASLLDYNPVVAVIVFDVLSSLIFAMMIVAVMLLLSILTDEILIWGTYLKTRFDIKAGRKFGFVVDLKEKLRVGFTKIFGFLMKVDWIKVNLKKIFWQSLVLSLPFIPLSILSLPVGVICCDIVLTVVFFYLGCRYRAEFYLGCVIATLFHTLFVYLFPYLTSWNTIKLATILSSASAALFLYLVLLFPVILASYITARILFWALEGKHPELMFEGDV
ncbi:MAG: signal peptidase I [Thermoplasmata archaeon]